MRAQASVFGGEYLEDHPSDADVTDLQMQHGDVLLLMTDGIFDNLSNQELLKLVAGRMVLSGAWTTIETDDEKKIVISDDLDQMSSSSSSSSTKQETNTNTNTININQSLQALLASTIAGEAKRASHNPRHDGPFAKEVQRYFPGHPFRGGKVDDICVLAVVAVDENRVT